MFNDCKIKSKLSESASFTFGFHETEDVIFTDGALDVADNGTGLVVNEFDTNLSDTTTGTGTTENLDNLGQFNGSLSILKLLEKKSILDENSEKVKVMMYHDMNR